MIIFGIGIIIFAVGISFIIIKYAAKDEPKEH